MLLISVRDIVAGDYCPDYGTVESVVTFADKSVRLTFKNGTVTDQTKDSKMIVDQGGMINRASYSS